MQDLSKKRICVTGGAGFLGTALVGHLRGLGCGPIFVPRRLEYDLTTVGGIERLFARSKPEVLFHLAAVVGGIGANRDNPGRFFYENAVMGIQLIEYARRNGVEKTIVAGTVCAYPKITPVPFREESLWEGYPDDTNAPYGIAKKALLVQCQAYRRQYGMNAIYLMPANLYGPGDHAELDSSHVIPALIRKFLEAKQSGAQSVVCWGDGSATREFLFLNDAARGLALAAQHYDGLEPVNLGSGEEISIRDLAEMTARFCEYEGRIVWDTSKPNGQLRRRLDTTRAGQCFGFRAHVALKDGLAKTIAWYREEMACPKAAVPAGC